MIEGLLPRIQVQLIVNQFCRIPHYSRLSGECKRSIEEVSSILWIRYSRIFMCDVLPVLIKHEGDESGEHGEAEKALCAKELIQVIYVI